VTALKLASVYIPDAIVLSGRELADATDRPPTAPAFPQIDTPLSENFSPTLVLDLGSTTAKFCIPADLYVVIVCQASSVDVRRAMSECNANHNATIAYNVICKDLKVVGVGVSTSCDIPYSIAAKRPAKRVFEQLHDILERKLWSEVTRNQFRFR
jgi:hypothetical protein